MDIPNIQNHLPNRNCIIDCIAMCNFFCPISDPNSPFYFIVSCFVDHDDEKDPMPFHDRAPVQRLTITARGLGEDSPILTTFDDTSQLRSGLLHRKKRNYAAAAETEEEYGWTGYGYYYPYRPKPGRKIDPRMLALLESFQELYFRRRDLFKRLFPKLHDEFAKLSEELAAEVRLQNQGKPAPALGRRSLSVGSPRVVSRDIGGEPPLRLDRFKVRTVDLDDDPSPAPPGGGTKNPVVPNPSKSAWSA